MTTKVKDVAQESCQGSDTNQYGNEMSKDDTEEQGELVFENKEPVSIQDECEYNEEEQEEQNVQDMNKMSEEARQTRGINLSIDTEEPTPFKTKHAACIAKILGSIDKVVEYDKLRYQLKSGERPARIQRQTHHKLLAELQSLVQSQ